MSAGDHEGEVTKHGLLAWEGKRRTAGGMGASNRPSEQVTWHGRGLHVGGQEPAGERENQALGHCHASKGRPSGLGSTSQERKQKEQRACGKGEGQQVAGSSEAKKKK